VSAASLRATPAQLTCVASSLVRSATAATVHEVSTPAESVPTDQDSVGLGDSAASPQAEQGALVEQSASSVAETESATVVVESSATDAEQAASKEALVLSVTAAPEGLPGSASFETAASGPGVDGASVASAHSEDDGSALARSESGHLLAPRRRRPSRRATVQVMPGRDAETDSDAVDNDASQLPQTEEPSLMSLRESLSSEPSDAAREPARSAARDSITSLPVSVASVGSQGSQMARKVRVRPARRVHRLADRHRAEFSRHGAAQGLLPTNSAGCRRARGGSGRYCRPGARHCAPAADIPEAITDAARQ
jgi:hypothetical protein